MKNGLKMKAGDLPKSPTIKAGQVNNHQLLSFSFRYIDHQHQKFDYSGREATYFCKVIERLTALSACTTQELHVSRSKALRVHPIEWGTTSEPDGFSHLNEQLRESRPYQFSISSNAHGRVHGFFLENVFHVVWLDPDHSLYP